MPELDLIDPGVWIGLSGGVVLFGSWILQAVETRRAGHPVVSGRFFALRVVGSLLLVVESFRVQSPGLFLVNLATVALMVYNLVLSRADERPKGPSSS